MISNKLIGEAIAQNDDVVTCQFLGNGMFLLRMVDDELPQKMNSYAVMKTVDRDWFDLQFSPRTFETNLTEDEQFCLEPPVRVAEEWDESDDSIGELDTLEDFANNWEEIESDDGHRELYENY
jgi:hypothetical protein